MRRYVGETMRSLARGLLGLAIALASMPVLAGTVDVTFAPDGRVAVLTVWEADGHLIYVAAPSEKDVPLVLLVERGKGAWRVVCDETAHAVRFLPLPGEEAVTDDSLPGRALGDEPGSPRNERDQRRSVLLAGLLDEAGKGEGLRMPAFLSRIRSVAGASR